jgi:hypothetical protein
MCRDFRAAYKARLFAAHPAAVELGVSWFGKAYLRAHSTVVLRLLSGLDLFTGDTVTGRPCSFYILEDGTLETSQYWCTGASLVTIVSEQKPDPTRPGARGFYAARVPDPHGRVRPSFVLECSMHDGDVSIAVSCNGVRCREAAGALAAICQYIQAHIQAEIGCDGQAKTGWDIGGQTGWSSPGSSGSNLGPGKAVSLTSLSFSIVQNRRRDLGPVSRGVLRDLAIALLPLSEVVQGKLSHWACPGTPDKLVAGLGG